MIEISYASLSTPITFPLSRQSYQVEVELGSYCSTLIVMFVCTSRCKKAGHKKLGEKSTSNKDVEKQRLHVG